MGLLDLWNKPPISIKEIVAEAVKNNNSLTIKYRKFDGTVSSRKISNVSYNNVYQEDGFFNDHIKGFCNLRLEERTFKIDRIVKAEIEK